MAIGKPICCFSSPMNHIDSSSRLESETVAPVTNVRLLEGQDTKNWCRNLLHSTGKPLVLYDLFVEGLLGDRLLPQVCEA